MSIHQLKSPQAVLQAMAEYDRLGRTYFLEKYRFGKSREYMLRDPGSGSLYDSNAIAGAAFGYEYPERGALRAEEFPGGEATVEQILANLGFEVVRVGQDWSAEEVEATVADYFAMLTLESIKAPYNKAEHNEQLRRILTTRSKGSIELKHQNISAVLDQQGLPFIRGYKPRTNLQELLRRTVLEYVDRHRATLDAVMDNFDAQTVAGQERYLGVLIDRPKVEAIAVPSRRLRLPRKLDWAAREEHNRLLGHGGEAWTMAYEQTRVAQEGRPDLVDRIDWISDRQGDGAGYDILSYETSEVARFIEVKTTHGGSLTPFVVTSNELSFAEEMNDAFCLYRLFEFGTAPKLFILRGELRANLDLEPMSYRCRLKALE